MWQGKLALNTITCVVSTAIQLILVSYMLHNRMQSMKSTQLGPVDRASPYLWTPVPAPAHDRVYNPSTAKTICES
jgi:hypothetical protein